MPGTNPEYITCRITILTLYIDRMDIEIATYKRLQVTVIAHENKSRPSRQQDKRA